MENIIKMIESHEIVLLKLFGFLGKFFVTLSVTWLGNTCLRWQGKNYGW